MLFHCQGSPAFHHRVLAAVCPLPAALRMPVWVTGGPLVFSASVCDSRDQRVGRVLLSSGDSSGHRMHAVLTQLSAEPGRLCTETTLSTCSSDKTLVMAVVKNLGSWVRADVSETQFPPL